MTVHMSSAHPHSRGREHGHGHSHGLTDPSVKRSRAGIRAVLLSLLVLGVTALAQVAIFAVSGSIALLADLVHNFGDAATAIPLGIAFALRSERAERWAGYFVVLAILVSACVAGYEAVDRLLNPNDVSRVGAVAVAGLLGFGGNLLAALIRTRAGRALESPALLADGSHARADAYVSLAVVASAVAVALGLEIADPLIGLAITVLIAKITWDSWRTVGTDNRTTVVGGRTRGHMAAALVGGHRVGRLARSQSLPRRRSSTMTTITDLKLAHRATWAAGDYGAVARHIDEAPPSDLLARAEVSPGQDVLDVATGTGNVALRAAAAGAQVVGLDLTPELFAEARGRAAAAEVSVDWVEGDAEELPFEDGCFDRVLSVFGVQFAPRHAVAAAELARVCRPGGRIGLVNWTPSGAIGELFSIMGQYMPAPPDYAQSPPLWGSEAHVRSLFAETGVELEFTYGSNPWRFDSVEDWVAFMETRYGPTIKARERLSGEGRWEECRGKVSEMAARRNTASDGSLVLWAEYLVVTGHKAG